MEAELTFARATTSKAEGLLSKTGEELKQRNEKLKVSESALRKQVSEMDAGWAKVAALEVANTELEKVNLALFFKSLKVFLFWRVANCPILLLQSLFEEKIAIMVQRKDDAKRWQKSYNKEMNVQLAHMFFLVTQQAVLPPKKEENDARANLV